MNKEQIFDYIKKRNIWYEVTEHKKVYKMADLDDIDIPYPDGNAKNLFLCDDRKKYFLLLIKGGKKVDLKKFRTDNSLRTLHFASSFDLDKIMKLEPGSVTPFGILNDEMKEVSLYIDKELNDIVGVHPNDNSATVWIKVDDLINIVKEHGNFVKVVEMSK